MSAQSQNNGASHGNPAYPADFCFNELPKNNWHYVTPEDKDAYVTTTLDRIKEVYDDVHGRKN